MSRGPARTDVVLPARVVSAAVASHEGGCLHKFRCRSLRTPQPRFAVPVVICIFLLCLCSPRATAQVSGPLTLRPGDPGKKLELFTLKAPTVEYNDVGFKAVGGVRFTIGEKRARAQEVTYDPRTGAGRLLNARFTTCNRENPHYYLSAKQIELRQDGRLTARGASLTLFGLKVITLPTLQMRLGAKENGLVLPNPGYDSRDGMSLSQSFRLMNTPRGTAVAGIRFTARHGYQFEMSGRQGLDGLLASPPGRFLRYDALANEVGDVSAKDGPLEHEPNLHAARLTAFGSLSLRSRAFDLLDTNLVYFKRPEVGLTYTPRHLNISGAAIDRRLELLPEISASWGRYAEIPSPYGTVQRTGASITLPVHTLRASKSSALQPVLTYSWARYSTGSEYRIYGWGLDYSKIYTNGSFLTLRYSQKRASGFTPFEFDDLDVTKDFEVGTQIRRGPHIYGFVGSYDVRNHSLADWEALYGYKLDCLAGVVSYNGRYRRIAFGVTILGI